MTEMDQDQIDFMHEYDYNNCQCKECKRRRIKENKLKLTKEQKRKIMGCIALMILPVMIWFETPLWLNPVFTIYFIVMMSPWYYVMMREIDETRKGSFFIAGA